MENVLFIIGAGRSGTTWLQLMLGSHPLIVTGQESQIFNRYLAPVVKRWEAEKKYPKTSELRFHGISAYISETELYELLTQFAVGVFEKALQSKPEAEYFLEKSPNNSLHLDTVFRCFPEARFIHLIRDGRDVVTSILSAKKSWGKNWSHKTIEDAAIEWKNLLVASKKIKDVTDNYLEIRYEDLLSDGLSQLQSVFDFLNIEISEAEAQQIYEKHSFDKLKNNKYEKVFINPGEVVASGTNSRPEPKDFFRKGISGDWKNFLSKADLQEFYYVAGNLLVDLGYEQKEVLPTKKPLRLKVRQTIKLFKHFAKKMLAKLGIFRG